MSSSTKKRTLDSFFSPVTHKKARTGESAEEEAGATANPNSSCHSHYPFPIPYLPSHIYDRLPDLPAAKGREIRDQPDLDLVYFQPYISKRIERDLFEFLRRELFFYRVQYTIKRGPTETQINTPRYTTVFGVDETSRFLPDGSLVDAQSNKPINATERYRSCKPRPIPQCLDELRKITEVLTCATYNFCLVNYYATGADSISYHSDDERFLGPNPCIASLSLGAQRDFLMKHKPPAAVGPASGARPASQPSSPANAIAPKPLKLSLGSGDMVLMRGPTQAHWLHSIPKRKGGEADKGRINITFRKALVRGGTENYYCYNVGNGGVWKWDIAAGEMRPR